MENPVCREVCRRRALDGAATLAVLAIITLNIAAALGTLAAL